MALGYLEIKALVNAGAVTRDRANAEWKRRIEAEAADRQRQERESEERDRNARIERLRAHAGIPPRHSSYDEWDALRGPDAYTRCVAAVRRFAERGDSVLALIGTRGTGKTQAGVVAICETINGGESARYTTAVELLADLKGRYSTDGPADTNWLGEWAGPHLLVIDEIADRLDTDHARVMLAALVDRRYRELRPTILIGNVTADQFAQAVGSSIADRAKEEGGLVRFDKWPSFRVATVDPGLATVTAPQTPRQGAVLPVQQTIGAPTHPNPPEQPAQSEAPGPGLAATAAAILATMDAARAERLQPAGGQANDPKALEFERQRKQAEAELAEMRKRRRGVPDSPGQTRTQGDAGDAK